MSTCISLLGVVCKKYEEPESCGSAANFLPGVEMEGYPPVRMEVEVDALMAVETDLYFNAHDIIKYQCPPPIVESNTAVDDANVGTDFVVIPDNVNAPTAVDNPVDGDQVEKELSIQPLKPSKPTQSRPKTSNKFGREKRRGNRCCCR